MSATLASRESVVRPLRLTPTERRILRSFDHSGAVNCSKEQLAVLLGRSHKTIDRLIKHLKALGLVSVTPRFVENGAQVANSYRLTELGRAQAERLRPGAGASDASDAVPAGRD